MDTEVSFDLTELEREMDLIVDRDQAHSSYRHCSHNMGILEAHWRRFCHIESQVVDSSYLFNNLYRKLSTKGCGPLMPIVVILRKLFLISVFSGV